MFLFLLRVLPISYLFYLFYCYIIASGQNWQFAFGAVYFIFSFFLFIYGSSPHLFTNLEMVKRFLYIMKWVKRILIPIAILAFDDLYNFIVDLDEEYFLFLVNEYLEYYKRIYASTSIDSIAGDILKDPLILKKKLNMYFYITSVIFSVLCIVYSYIFDNRPS